MTPETKCNWLLAIVISMVFTYSFLLINLENRVLMLEHGIDAAIASTVGR
jgi:hypothetical protein